MGIPFQQKYKAYIPSDQKEEVMAVNALIVREMLEQANNINGLKMIPWSRESVDHMAGFMNQILLIMRNGRYMMMEPKCDSFLRIRQFLGVKILRIRYWHPMNMTPDHQAPWVAKSIYTFGLNPPQS